MIVRRKRRAAIRSSAGFDLERGHRDRRWFAGCAGKDRYTSEVAARAGAGLQIAGAKLDAYHCDDCGGWHLTSSHAPGPRKVPTEPVHMLAFVRSRCHARHADVAASATPWTPERRRAALLALEPLAIRDGWSVGVVDDHCPTCASALGLETLRGAA